MSSTVLADLASQLFNIYDPHQTPKAKDDPESHSGNQNAWREMGSPSNHTDSRCHLFV